jgi:hypothetical protein
MIVLFPLIIVAAAVVVARGGRRGSGSDGIRWFAAWTVAGAAITFSFLTGFSIGLFVLPVAAAILLLVARRAPYPADALGFLNGIGAVLLVVAFLNRSSSSVDPMPWLLVGLSLSGSALLLYSLSRCRALRAGTESR